MLAAGWLRPAVRLRFGPQCAAALRSSASADCDHGRRSVSCSKSPVNTVLHVYFPTSLVLSQSALTCPCRPAVIFYILSHECTSPFRAVETH